MIVGLERPTSGTIIACGHDRSGPARSARERRRRGGEVQAQVLNLLADIRDSTGVSYILISHDLAVVCQLAEHAIVLWRGRVVEQGPTAAVPDDPQHEYTRRLRASAPRPGWKPARRTAPAMPELR